MERMNKCLFCGKLVKNKFCNISCYSRYYNPLRFTKPRIEIKLICPKCGKEFTQRVKKEGKDYIRKFCSRSCANSRCWTLEDKLKKSKTALESEKVKKANCIIGEQRRKNYPLFYVRKCIICGQLFWTDGNKAACSKKCGRVLGGRAASRCRKESKRSVNEIYFSELCKSRFYDVKTNQKMFNGWDADVIIEDLKVAILWNGLWHYKKLTKLHSVEQVQNRDRIKIKEIVKHGYIPYVIKDVNNGDKQFVEDAFYKFLEYMRVGGKESRHPHKLLQSRGSSCTRYQNF